MIRINESASEVTKLADEIVAMYMREDYDYLVKEVKAGRTEQVGNLTVKDELQFMKRNNLGQGMSINDLNKVAKLAVDKLLAIEYEILDKHQPK